LQVLGADLLPLGLHGGHDLRVDEGGRDVDHHDTPLGGDPFYLVVGQVAGDVAQGAARGVRGEHRGARRLQHVVDRLVRDVRHGHHYTDPVHLAHDDTTEIAQPVVRLVVGGIEVGQVELPRRVGPVVGV